jgi:hypothetical protein
MTWLEIIVTTVALSVMTILSAVAALLLIGRYRYKKELRQIERRRNFYKRIDCGSCSR